MPTATAHLTEVGGYAGPARCWQLDPPAQIGGAPSEYVTIWITRATVHQAAEVVVVPANETGASTHRSLQRRGGSFVLHRPPATQEDIDGAHWLALQLLGGYLPTVDPDGQS